MKEIPKSYSPEEILEERLKKIYRGRARMRIIAQVLVLAAVVCAAFLWILGIARVEGDSMAPTLQEEELLLFYRLDREYLPGDMVLFERDGYEETVKRVVATAGDVVDIDAEKGILLINEKPVEESYVYAETLPTSEKVTFPLEVEEGQVFVLGDNREASGDSRDFGCVQVSDITGRVLWWIGKMF
ncbi:MAG: signal peptidase I [Lachnospiraceae bacterium]|nr:signal peptidase I [Lachnospiraceae bacterium]